MTRARIGTRLGRWGWLAAFALSCGGEDEPSGSGGSAGSGGAAGSPGAGGSAGSSGGGAGAGGASDCVPGGCSGQLCAEAGDDPVTPCEDRPEYACYRDATCERQPGGSCGWTPSASLEACLTATQEGTRWYLTCGDPVCRPDAGPSDAPACSDGQQEGDPCAAGAPSCDPGQGCGVLLQCASSDPRMQPGGCPISRRRFKRNVTKLNAGQRLKLSRELLDLPIVTYRLKGNDDTPQLGFILEDSAPAFAVDAPRDRVNLYGFTSLAVVALQEQQRELDRQRERIERQAQRIEQLERRLDELRR